MPKQPRPCFLCRKGAQARVRYRQGLVRLVCTACLGSVRRTHAPKRRLALVSGAQRLIDLPLYELDPPVDAPLFEEEKGD